MTGSRAQGCIDANTSSPAIHRIAEAVRRAVSAWGFKLVAKAPRWDSDTVSAIYVPEGFDGNEVPRYFFDFEDMIKTNANGYFSYTPPTG